MSGLQSSAIGVAIFLIANAALAALPNRDSPIEVTADELQYEQARELYIAEGHVRIVQRGRSIEADWIAFSHLTGHGVASGDVVYVDGNQVLTARFLEFDLESLEGVVFRGGLDTGSGGFRVEARELRRTGDDRYEVTDATFTTCRCPDDGRDPWQIEADEAKVHLGGYGTVQNSTFEVLGVPVFWLPWMFFPVKSERESGMLFPEFGVGGREGVAFGVPFFWAAHDRLNAIFTPSYLTKRGFKPDLELEYVFGQRSEGQVAGSWVKDKNPDADQLPHRNRWYVEWEQDQFLPGGVRLRGDVRAISDNRYVDDFQDLSRFRNDRFLESQVFAFRNFGRDRSLALNAGATYADSLQGTDAFDRDDFVQRRLPQASAELLPVSWARLGGLTTSLPVHYIRFDPQKSASQLGGRPDGSEDGEREPLIDRGNRIVLHPRLGYPLRLLDFLEALPEVGWYETLYPGEEGRGFARRGLLTSRLDLRTRMVRQFDLPFAEGLTHMFIPRLEWAFVSKDSQTGNPLYVPPTAVPQRRLRQLALDNVLFDPADRIRRANRISFGFGNRVYIGRSRRYAGQLKAEATLIADYDFFEGRFGRILLDGRTFPAGGFGSRFILSFDPGEVEIDEGLLSVSKRFRQGSSVFLAYRFLREIPSFIETGVLDSVNQIDVGTRIRLTDRWAIGWAGQYSIEDGALLRNAGFVEFTSRCRCWAVAFEIGDNRRTGIQFNFRYTLLGLGDNSENPFGSGSGLSLSPVL